MISIFKTIRLHFAINMLSACQKKIFRRLMQDIQLSFFRNLCQLRRSVTPTSFSGSLQKGLGWTAGAWLHALVVAFA